MCRATPIGLVYGLITMNIVRGLILAVLWGGVVAGLEEYRRVRPPANS
jgi:hypothetical protein